MNNLYESIADRLTEEGTPTTPEAVEDALKHRTFPDDYFWNAWDNAVGAGAELYSAVKEQQPESLIEQSKHLPDPLGGGDPYHDADRR